MTTGCDRMHTEQTTATSTKCYKSLEALIDMGHTGVEVVGAAQHRFRVVLHDTGRLHSSRLTRQLASKLGPHA